MQSPAPQLIHELVAAAADDAPQELAAIDADTQVNFAELEREVGSLSGWVGERTGLGDRIAVVADNSVDYLRLYYGVPHAGRVLVLINQRLSAEEQVAMLAQAEPILVVGDRQYLEALPRLDEKAPTIRGTVAFGSDELHGALSGTARPAATGEPDDTAWLLFTSGSTGPPKMVTHTHRSLLAAANATVVGRSVEAGGTYLLPFPMCHVAGYNALVQHATPSTVVLISQFRPAEFVDVVNRHGVRSCSLAPTMLHGLLAHLERSGDAMPSLRSIAYGSAAVSTDLIARAGEHLEVDFHHSYGMTETAGNVTFLGPDEHRAGLAGDTSVLRTAGRPHDGIETRIVDEDGTDVAAGAAGEVVLRGAQVTAGYWKADAVSDDESWFPDGWFRTGDIGRIDGNGRLSIVDRRKDVIITGGENVSSREVEDVLSTHPAVDSVAVVGVPDEYWGEAICAVVVPRSDDHPGNDELIDHVRARLSSFKRPRHVVFIEALPLTTNGKVDKVALRQLARAAVETP